MTYMTEMIITSHIFSCFLFYSDITVLVYLQEMKHIGVVAWLLVTLVVCIDPLCGQYLIFTDPKITLPLEYV